MFLQHARRHFSFILLATTSLATLANLSWHYTQNIQVETNTIAQVKSKPDNKKDCNGCSVMGYEWKWNSALDECKQSNTKCGTDNKPKTDPTKSSSKSECEKSGNYGIWCESVDSSGKKYAFCIDSRESKGCNAVAQEKGYTINPGNTGLACGTQVAIGETTIGAANKLYICTSSGYAECNGSNGCSPNDLPTVLPTHLSQGTGKATCYVGTTPYPHGRIYEKSASENLQCNNGQLVPVNLKTQDVLDSVTSEDDAKRNQATAKVKALCQAQQAPNCNTNDGLSAFQQLLLTQVLPPSQSAPLLKEIKTITQKNQDLTLITTFLNDQDITQLSDYSKHLADCSTKKGSACTDYELTQYLINLLPDSIAVEGGKITKADLLKDLENSQNLKAYNAIGSKLEAATTEEEKKALLAELKKIPTFTGTGADGKTQTINPAQESADILLKIYNQSQVVNVLNTLENNNISSGTNHSAVVTRCINAGNRPTDCTLPSMLEKYALDFLAQEDVSKTTLSVPTTTTPQEVTVTQLAQEIMLEKQKRAIAQSAYSVALQGNGLPRTLIYDHPFLNHCESLITADPTTCSNPASLALMAENFLKTEDPIQYAKLQIAKNPAPTATPVTNQPISFGGRRGLLRPLAPSTTNNTSNLDSQTAIIKDTIEVLLKTAEGVKQGDLITLVSSELLSAGYSSEAIHKATESFCETGPGQCLYDPIADKFVRIDPVAASSPTSEQYGFFNAAYQSILNNSGVNKGMLAPTLFENYTNSGNLGQKCRWGEGSLYTCNNPLLSCQGGVLGFGSTCQLTKEAQSQIALGIIERQYTSFAIDNPFSDKEAYELQLKLYNNPLNQPILNSGINASAIATNRLLSANGCGVGRDSYMSQGVCWVCLDSTSKSRFQAPDPSYCDPDKKELLLSKIPGRECEVAGGYCADQNTVKISGVFSMGPLDCPRNGEAIMLCLKYNPPDSNTIARRNVGQSCSNKADELCANGLMCINNICTSELHAAFIPEAEAGVWASNVEKNFPSWLGASFIAKNIVAPISRYLDPSYRTVNNHQANILTNIQKSLLSDPQALNLLENPDSLTTNINSLMNANALLYKSIQDLDVQIKSGTYTDLASANKYKNMAELSIFTQAATGGKDWNSLENEDVIGIGVTLQSLTGDNQYNQSFLNCAAAGGSGAACNAFKLEVILTTIDVITPPIPGADDLLSLVGIKAARGITAVATTKLATQEMTEIAAKGIIRTVADQGAVGLKRVVWEYIPATAGRHVFDTPRFTAEILLPTIARPLTQTASLLTRPISEYAQGAATRLAQNTLIHSVTNATTTLTKTAGRAMIESSVGFNNRTFKNLAEGLGQSILDLTENQTKKQINNFLTNLNPATLVGKTDTELTNLLKAGGITSPTKAHLLETRELAVQKLLTQAAQSSQNPLSFAELAQIMQKTPRYKDLDQDKIIARLGSIFSDPDLSREFLTRNFDELVKAGNIEPELLAKTFSTFDQSANFLRRYDLPINLKTSQAFTNLGQAGLDQATLLPRLSQDIGDAQLAARVARALELEKVYQPPAFLTRLASFNPLARSTALPPITPISSNVDLVRESSAITVSIITNQKKLNQIRAGWSPETLPRSGTQSEIYRLRTNGLTGDVLEQTHRFNTMLDEFESSVGFHLRENQVNTLKNNLSILQLEAGGGKSAVITRILSTEDNINFALFKSATEKADYISDQILTPEGIKYHQTRGATVIDIDSQHGFRQIELKVGQAHDVTKAKRLSAQEVEALLAEAATNPTKQVVFVGDRANTIWTRLGGNAQTDLSWWQKLTRQTGETAEGKLIKELTSKKSRFGTSNFVVDEIGDDIIGNFAVSGRGKALKDVKDPNLLGGLNSGQTAIKTHREVTASGTELDKLLKERLVELGTGQGESSLLTAVGKGQFVPTDELVHARSLSEIIDQSLGANPGNTPLSQRLRTLQTELKSGDKAKSSQAISELEAILSSNADQAANRQLLTDLAYRKNTLQDSWAQLARVPDTDFALEGGELVLRKAMGTTGERLGKTTQLLPFYDYGPRMLQAFDDYLIQKGSAKQIAFFSLENIPIFGKGTQMSVDSFYQEILANGHRFKAFDATPDTAAHLLSRQASGVSEIISAKPTNFGVATETEELLTQLVENRAKNYSNMATAIVMPDTNPNLSHDLQRLVQLAENKNVGYKEVVVAQYATRPDGIETIEYVSYKVLKDVNGQTSFELPPLKLKDLRAWNEHIATALGKGNPEELAIVYLGRPRAVDLKVTNNHLNIRWSHFNDDSLTRSTSETITQEIKRNRLMVEANQNLVNATPGQIARATEYDLYLRVADPSLATTLNRDNVMQDYFVQNLYTHLSEVRVQALLSNLQLAPSRQLDQLDALLDNLTLNPVQRQAVTRASQKLRDELSTQTSSFASLMESTVSRDPLVGEKLYLELARRGEATNKQLLSMAETIKKYAGLTDQQLGSLKLALGAVDNFDPIRASYLDLLQKPSAGLVTPKSQGPADLLLAFAQNNSTNTATSPYYRAAKQSFVASTAESSAPKTVASTTGSVNVPTGLVPTNAPTTFNNRVSQAISRPPSLTINGQTRALTDIIATDPKFQSITFTLSTGPITIARTQQGLFIDTIPYSEAELAQILPDPNDVVSITYNNQPLATNAFQTPTSRKQLADNLAAGTIPQADIPTALEQLGLTTQDTRALQTHLLAQARPVTQPAPQPQAPTPVAVTPPQAPAKTAPAPQAQSTPPSFSVIANDGQTLGTLPLNTSLKIEVFYSADGTTFSSLSYSQGDYATIEQVEREISMFEARARQESQNKGKSGYKYYITLEQANNHASKITYNPELGHTLRASGAAPSAKTASSFWDQDETTFTPHPAYNPNNLSFPRGVDVNTGEFSRIAWILSWNPFAKSPWHQLNTLLSELRAKKEYEATIITRVQALNLSEEVTNAILSNLLWLPAELTPIARKLQSSTSPSSLTAAELQTIEDALQSEYAILLEATQRGDFENYQELQQYYFRQMQKFGYFKGFIDQKAELKTHKDHIEQIMSGYEKYQKDVVEKIKFGITEGTIAVDPATDISQLVRGQEYSSAGSRTLAQQATIRAQDQFREDTIAQVIQVARERIALEATYYQILGTLAEHLSNLASNTNTIPPQETIDAVYALRSTLENRAYTDPNKNIPKSKDAYLEFVDKMLIPVMDNIQKRLNPNSIITSHKITAYLRDFEESNFNNSLIADLAQDQSLLTPETNPTTPAQAPRNTANLARLATFLDDNFSAIGEDYSDLLRARLAQRQEARYNPDTLSFPRGVDLSTGEFSSRTYFASFLPFLNTPWHQVNTALTNYRSGITGPTDTQKAIRGIKGLTQPIQDRIIASLPRPHHVVDLAYDGTQSFQFNSNYDLPIAVGRKTTNTNNTIEYPGVPMTNAISKQHLSIIRENGQWMIQDLRSRAGTQINGQALTPLTLQPLNSGDVIALAGITNQIAVKIDAQGNLTLAPFMHGATQTTTNNTSAPGGLPLSNIKQLPLPPSKTNLSATEGIIVTVFDDGISLDAPTSFIANIRALEKDSAHSQLTELIQAYNRGELSPADFLQSLKALPNDLISPQFKLAYGRAVDPNFTIEGEIPATAPTLVYPTYLPQDLVDFLRNTRGNITITLTAKGDYPISLTHLQKTLTLNLDTAQPASEQQKVIDRIAETINNHAALFPESNITVEANTKRVDVPSSKVIEAYPELAQDINARDIRPSRINIGSQSITIKDDTTEITLAATRSQRVSGPKYSEIITFPDGLNPAQKALYLRSQLYSLLTRSDGGYQLYESFVLTTNDNQTLTTTNTKRVRDSIKKSIETLDKRLSTTKIALQSSPLLGLATLGLDSALANFAYNLFTSFNLAIINLTGGDVGLAMRTLQDLTLLWQNIDVIYRSFLPQTQTEQTVWDKFFGRIVGIVNLPPTLSTSQKNTQAVQIQNLGQTQLTGSHHPQYNLTTIQMRQITLSTLTKVGVQDFDAWLNNLTGKEFAANHIQLEGFVPASELASDYIAVLAKHGFVHASDGTWERPILAQPANLQNLSFTPQQLPGSPKRVLISPQDQELFDEYSTTGKLLPTLLTTWLQELPSLYPTKIVTLQLPEDTTTYIKGLLTKNGFTAGTTQDGYTTWTHAAAPFKALPAATRTRSFNSLGSVDQGTLWAIDIAKRIIDWFGSLTTPTINLDSFLNTPIPADLATEPLILATTTGGTAYYHAPLPPATNDLERHILILRHIEGLLSHEGVSSVSISHKDQETTINSEELKALTNTISKLEKNMTKDYETSNNTQIIKDSSGQDRYIIWQDSYGEGDFGKVHLGKDLITGQIVIIKNNFPFIEDKHQITPSRQVENQEKFGTEFDTVKQLNHPNIVKMIDLIRNEDGSFSLVQEYIPGTRVSLVAIGEDAIPVSHNLVKQFVHELSDAIDYMYNHKETVVHSDLNPNNIIYDPISRRFVIIDFGNSNKVIEVMRTTTNGYHPWQRYFDTEIQNPYRDEIFTLAVNSYLMIAKEHPFDHENTYPHAQENTNLARLGDDIAPIIKNIFTRNFRPLTTYDRLNINLSEDQKKKLDDLFARVFSDDLGNFSSDDLGNFSSATAFADALTEILDESPRLTFTSTARYPFALGFVDQGTLWAGDIISRIFQTIGRVFSRATPEVSTQPVEQIVVAKLNTKPLTHTRETVRVGGNVTKRASTSLSANGRRLSELLFTNNYSSIKQLLDLKDNSQVARVLGVSQDEAQALLSQLQDSRTQQLINQSLAGKARSKSEQAIITKLIGEPQQETKLFTDLYKELYGHAPSAFQVFTLRQRLLPLARWHANLTDTQRPTERELKAILLQGRLPISLTTRLSLTKTGELKDLMLSLRSHAPYIINEAQIGAASTITLHKNLSVEELGLVTSKLNQEFAWGFQLDSFSNSIYQNTLTKPTTEGGLGLTKFEGYKYRKTTFFTPIEVFVDQSMSQIYSWLTPIQNLLADFFIDLVGAPIESVWVKIGLRDWAARVELRILGYQTGGITREMSRQALVSGFHTGAFWALPGYFGDNGRLTYSAVRITGNLVKNGSNMFAHIFKNLAEANSIQEKTALIALNLTGGTVTFAAQAAHPLAYYAVLIFDTINTNLVNTARNYQITNHLTSSVSFRIMEAFKNGSSVGYLASGLQNSFTTARQSFTNQDAPTPPTSPTQTATTTPTEAPTEVPTQVPTQEPTAIPATPTTEPTVIPEPVVEEVEEIVKEYASIDDHTVEIITDRKPRVMILGDSISVSIVSGLNDILAKEQEVEFVGSAEIHGIAHEGHVSYTTQLFLESLEAGEWRDYTRGVRPDEGAGYANTITKDNAPDIIVIQFGTNDAANGLLGTYRANIETIIAHYRELNPHTQVILSRIPNTTENFQDNVVALNRQLYQIAQDMPGVYYTETTQSLNPADLAKDGVHLQGSGINTTNAGIIKELNPALDIISPPIDSESTNSTEENVSSSIPTSDEHGLVYYSQLDDDWSDTLLPNSKTNTIGLAGCGPTTTSMILSSYIDSDLNPELVMRQYFEDIQSGSDFSHIREALEENKFIVKGYNLLEETAFEQAKWVVQNSEITYLALRFTMDGNTYTHHSIAVDIDIDGQIVMYDPFFGKNSTISSDGKYIQSPEGSITPIAIIGIAQITPPNQIDSTDSNTAQQSSIITDSGIINHQLAIETFTVQEKNAIAPRTAYERVIANTEMMDYILKYSRIYNLDPAYVAAIIAVESNGYEDIVNSPQGAVGPMQVMPSDPLVIEQALTVDLASTFGDRPTRSQLSNTETNIMWGTKIFSGYLTRNNNDLMLATKGYGPLNYFPGSDWKTDTYTHTFTNENGETVTENGYYYAYKVMNTYQQYQHLFPTEHYISHLTEKNIIAIGDAYINNSHSFVNQDNLFSISQNNGSSIRIAELTNNISYDNFDGALVWIGYNNPQNSIAGLENIYKRIRESNTQIIGVTQFIYTRNNQGISPTQQEIDNIVLMNNWIRENADIVIDLARSDIVNEDGTIRREYSSDGHNINHAGYEYIYNLYQEATDSIDKKNYSNNLNTLNMVLENKASQDTKAFNSPPSTEIASTTTNSNFLTQNAFTLSFSPNYSEWQELTSLPSYISHQLNNPGISIISGKIWDARNHLPIRDGDMVTSYYNRTPESVRAVVEYFNVDSIANARYLHDGAETFCNIFVWDVTRALGVEIPHWWNGQEMTANAIQDWLETDGKEYGWREVTPEEAQHLANQGVPAIAVEKRPGLIGHIAIVISGEGQYHQNTSGMETFYPTIAQAGYKNFVGETVKQGFVGIPRYYVNEGPAYSIPASEQTSLPTFAGN